jgi:two-component system, cell cycle sensor histidine kinase and response regulator CckA
VHRLLARQLRKYFPDGGPPGELGDFLEAVSAAYAQADVDRALLERSLELTSQELLQRWSALQREIAWRARSQAETELQSTAIAAATDAIGISDEHGLLVYVNAAHISLFGYEGASELVGQSWSILFDPEEFSRLDSLVAPALAATGRWVGEAVGRKATGERFEQDMSLTRTSNGTVWVTRDVSERKRLERSLWEAQKLDAIGGLAGGVAHDFNNLLSVVLSYSELLVEDLAPDNPMRADLEEIRGAGERATILTRQLLAFSRRQLLQPRVVRLNDIVLGMEAMLRRLLGEDIELAVVCAPNLCRAMLDPGQLEQVIMNLAVNGRDAMPSGGTLTIETRDVVLGARHAAEHRNVVPGPHVMLSVIDSGTGMSPDIQARIFEPFFTTKPVGKGTGLGLSTVSGIVQQSGGSICVESEPGRGTTFRVYFPRTESRLLLESRPPQPSRSPGGAETILLVEDDPSVRNLAHSILFRRGYRVLMAESAGEALLVCEQHEATIDLVVTDVVMPRMSGPQLARRLRSIRPGMRVLYMSGYSGEAIGKHGVLDPTLAFLQKPITKDALTRAVREALDAPAAPIEAL